jgi:hypothetical protein
LRENFQDGMEGKAYVKGSKNWLVKSVLTSIVTYHATVYHLLKWLIKEIDMLEGISFGKGKIVKATSGAFVKSNGTMCADQKS